MTAIDLGYGTTMMYAGSECLEEATLYPRGDGKLVAIPERQLRILSCALQYGTREAAFRDGIALNTAKNILTRLYKKLGVLTRDEAAIALGWLVIPEALLDASPEDDPGETTGPSTGGRSVAGPSGGHRPVVMAPTQARGA